MIKTKLMMILSVFLLIGTVTANNNTVEPTGCPKNYIAPIQNPCGAIHK